MTRAKRRATKPSQVRASSQRSTPTADELFAAQRERLRLGEHEGLATQAQAARFLGEVAIALRYGASDALPLASMYQAVARPDEPEREAQRRATVLTNALIADGVAIETNVIADRLSLAHVSIVPALIALRRRGKAPEVSSTARAALAFIAETPRPTAGQVRAHLGVPPKTWPNPADDALAELTRWFLIDRGAAEVPENGAPYLSKDGIPYRVFDAGLVRAAQKLSVAAAAEQLVHAYLRGALIAKRTKLASMFKLCLSKDELDAAIAALAGRVDGGAVIVLSGKPDSGS